MPGLPAPQGATEAAPSSGCREAVLSHADPCTAGPAAAAQPAREASARAPGTCAPPGRAPSGAAGRRASRLPRTPLPLTAVRGTAAAREEAGQGHRLDPDPRLRLHSGRAARRTGPPLQRPVALRGLRGLRDPQQADAELPWPAEAEPPGLTAGGRPAPGRDGPGRRHGKTR